MIDFAARGANALKQNNHLLLTELLQRAAERTRRAKPVGSPPGYPPSRLLIGQLTGSPVSRAAFALLVVRSHVANCMQIHFCGLGQQNWLPWQHPLRD